MNEAFVLPVDYKGKIYELEARLAIQGYTHKFVISIENNEYIFELDDNREYRVIRNTAAETSKEADTELLQAIILKLRELED